MQCFLYTRLLLKELNANILFFILKVEERVRLIFHHKQRHHFFFYICEQREAGSDLRFLPHLLKYIYILYIKRYRPPDRSALIIMQVWRFIYGKIYKLVSAECIILRGFN